MNDCNPEPEDEKRKPGRPARKNHKSAVNWCDEVRLMIGAELRAQIITEAKKRGLTTSQHVKDILLRRGASVTLPEDLIARVNRNLPGGCSTEDYVRHLVADGLNQRGEI